MSAPLNPVERAMAYAEAEVERIDLGEVSVGEMVLVTSYIAMAFLAGYFGVDYVALSAAAARRAGCPAGTLGRALEAAPLALESARVAAVAVGAVAAAEDAASVRTRGHAPARLGRGRKR